MTREEVKAQLAKSPLEWTSSNEPDGKNVHTATIPFELEPNSLYGYSFEYRVIEVCGYADLELAIYEIKGHDEISCDIFFHEGEVSEVKEYSEEHRLNLVCSLLGIKE
ncbi:hypothetical protein [Porphyromonas sp. oral taxon 275]|uniref:hypothetical protein n=1 Tax=Porphyromonas sp. oral taxon 275 TaxID=712435 RepID=UPI001BA6110A|nr:hypothetical protein [Porphyromonas sp. oral taxon 275]QUB43836.1 hypothetical protein J4862_04265 [Porphyromonas sp. oral taxon 275]